MTRFAVRKPISTEEASITVDGGLEVGAHRFQLQVATADGRVSKPDVVVVNVVRRIVIPDQPIVPTRPVVPGGTIIPDRPIIPPE